MKSYTEISPSVGELRSKIVDAQVLLPGEYQGRIADRQPADRTHSYVTIATNRGVHIECVEDELIEGLVPGVTVALTIERVPGLALLAHAGQFAVRGPDGTRLTEYGPIQVATEYIEQSSTPIERVGITSIKVIV